MYVCIIVGKRACVEPLKNKIEILKTDVIMNVTFCQDYIIVIKIIILKKSSDCTKINTIIKVKF